MELEITRDEIQQLVVLQVQNFFTLRDAGERSLLGGMVDHALERCDYCFRFASDRYYKRNGSTYFNPFHSGQYAIFLYFLAHSIYGSYPEARTLADRVYYLNRALNGVDLFYEVNLPKVFMLDHPLASIMGRATYGEFFTFSQECTVGNNRGIYPVIGENVSMMAGSKIVGNCRIGRNVIIGANAYVKDTDIDSCSIVFGSSPNLVIKTRNEEYFKGAWVGRD